MEVSLAKRLILSVSMHGGRYFFIQPFLFFPFLFQTDAKEAAPVLAIYFYSTSFSK